MTDPGVAAERTDLAWTRTALSFAVVGLLAARLAAPESLGRALAVALAPFASAALAASARVRARVGYHATVAALSAGTVVTAAVIALV